ncbi:D-erythrose-4-phosphate dehydrogenase [Candidatus Bilamarchaeum dharawalense]|uniref:glyceraldehyde-3-phosphate dehydrogenase (NAD(P)(+)) (phosphorylating) n=1 Tax=Candidatus Bilamarchaeum dharawalense TaxID=2885759 RepID=A0A5E4LQR3_9ARCH|nr:D-erythrose-4-phosphate dehydrogenase [Candidatus Bilamarchaeum dharawalense]
MKVAISGFGRIGKSFLKAAIKQGVLGKDFDVVAINTKSAVEQHVHLFKYDSVYGRFDGEVKAADGYFIVNGYKIKWINETDPLKLPWKELEVDVVLESSGTFRGREDSEKHIKAGAKKVLISAPGENVDATIVPGVNDHILNKNMVLLSLASCTTNCLAPIVKVMDEKFGIENGFLSTIHAYTNDQNILDASHKDLRRARAGAVSIIPTSTGAAKAIGEVLPQLNGKMDGVAFRVPVPDGSMNDMTFLLKKPASKDEINAELKRASNEELKGILGYTDEPIVSVDIIGTTYSAIVDSKLTKVQGRLVKVSAWYDNEFGYSNRLVDFVKKLKQL